MRAAHLLVVASFLACGRSSLEDAAPTATLIDATGDVGVDAVDIPLDGGVAEPDEGTVTLDAELDVPVDARDELPPWVDAGCVDGSVPDTLGAPYACGMDTCYSGSGYCDFVSGGQAQILYGTCQPFPCTCGAVPSCDCLPSHILIPPCVCRVLEGGIVTVQCVYP